MIRECKNKNEVIGYIIEDKGEFIPIGNIENYPDIIKAIEYKDIITEDKAEGEKDRIRQIESKCNQIIVAVYPIYKQLNITNLLPPYTEEDRDIMKAFIDSKRAICHKAVVDGADVEDINWKVING